MINYTTYHHADRPQVFVLEASGRLDHTMAQYMLDCIEGYIEHGERKIVIDCSSLQAISSLGLATLVRANSRIKSIGGELAIANASGIVAEALRLVHFDRLFHLFDSVDDAAASLAEN